VIKLHEEVATHGNLPNFIGARRPVNSNLNIHTWRTLLENYEHRHIVDYLEFGWPINIQSESYIPPSVLHPRNHKSATLYASHVDQFISEECQHDAIAGPFATNPFPFPVATLPLQTVEKRNSDKRRVVVDCSFPYGHSLNEAVPNDTYLGDTVQLTYPSVDTMTQMILNKGAGCLIYKTDLSRAYRQLPVDPKDYKYLCYRWRGAFYVDTRLVFGLRSSAYVCQTTTSAVTFIQKEKGYDVCNYLDDFGGAEVPEVADTAFADLQSTLASLGLDESEQKAVPPTTCMTFLGIEFDTVSMTRRVPQFRLEEIRLLINSWLNKKKATRRELQSLIGKLVFVSSCVPPGRLFISRMLEALRSLRRNHHRLRLSRDFRLDLLWWHRFMDTYNGVSMMVPDIYSYPDELVMTDACATGCGAFCDGQFFHSVFPDHVLEKFGSKIHVLEMLTIVLAARKWGPRWFGQRISLYCDNMACVYVLNSGRARDRDLLHCARELWLLAAKFEFQVKASHIQGSHNRIADHLSRWHLSAYHAQQFTRLTQHRLTVEIPVFQEDFILDCPY